MCLTAIFHFMCSSFLGGTIITETHLLVILSLKLVILLLLFFVFFLSHIFPLFNSLINFVSFCSSLDPHGPIAPRIWTHAQVKVVKGESLELVCVAQSWPAASYRWYKEDEETGFISVVPVQFNSHIITSSNEIVVINHADVNHQGKWLCSANNSVGEERISIRVYVIEPLQINIEPAKLIVDIGKPATFNCTVRGNPINYPLVWYKNGKLLVNDVYGGLSMNNKIKKKKVISFHHNLLNIKSVSREDAGQLIYLYFVLLKCLSLIRFISVLCTIRL